MKRIDSHTALLLSTAALTLAAFSSPALALDRHGRFTEPTVEVHLEALNALRANAETTHALAPTQSIDAQPVSKLVWQEGPKGQQLSERELQASEPVKKEMPKPAKRVAKANPKSTPKEVNAAKETPAPEPTEPTPAQAFAAAVNSKPTESAVEPEKEMPAPPPAVMAEAPPPVDKELPPAVTEQAPPPPLVPTEAPPPPPPPVVEAPPPVKEPPPVLAEQAPPPPVIAETPPPAKEPPPILAEQAPPPPTPVAEHVPLPPPTPEKAEAPVSTSSQGPQLLGQMSDPAIAEPPAPAVQVAKAEPAEPAPVALTKPDTKEPAEKAMPAAVEAPPPPPPVVAEAPPPQEPPPLAAAPIPEQQLASIPPSTITAPAPAGPATAAQIVFGLNDTVVIDDMKPQLKDVADKLKKDTSLRVSVVGYASGTPDQTSTARRVSLARALAVRAYLIDQGVDTLRINVQAEGNNVKEGQPDRVDLQVLSQPVPAKS